VFASSTSGDLNFYEIVIIHRPPPIRIGDERERLVAASLVMTMSWDPSWEEAIPRRTAS
jgi:hypothetical protein